jgi:AraC-like DNA-binding protein
MSEDPLSDVLRSVRLRGAVYFYVSCRGEWVAEAPAARDIADVVMPGAEHVMAYHLISKGAAWAATEHEAPLRVASGEIVLLPQGDPHVLSSAPGLRARRVDDGQWLPATRDQPRPFPVTYSGDVIEPSTIVICGFIGCDLRPFNPLIAALPRLLHLRASGVGAWVGPVLHQAVAESRQHCPGSDAVLDRISEVVFVDSARQYLESLPADASGWLAGLRDRQIGKALRLLHERPAEPWTIDELGRQVGLSRSALHERFAALVGKPPMQYLTDWRMQCAAGLLRDGQATVATIAQAVGYDSEAAFARAFKRLVGQPPAEWRRTQRRSR